jgi:hypothetical protein
MNLKRAQEIVGYLTGSCQGVCSVLVEGEDEYDETLVAAIEENIFNCACCGWWCENEEMTGQEDGPMCRDCEKDLVR